MYRSRQSKRKAAKRSKEGRKGIKGKRDKRGEAWREKRQEGWIERANKRKLSQGASKGEQAQVEEKRRKFARSLCQFDHYLSCSWVYTSCTLSYAFCESTSHSSISFVSTLIHPSHRPHPSTPFSTPLPLTRPLDMFTQNHFPNYPYPFYIPPSHLYPFSSAVVNHYL